VHVPNPKKHKILTAILAGILVWAASCIADAALLPLDHTTVIRQMVGNWIGGLMATVVSLALQLQSEEVHYRSAMQRVAIVAELNHHVRNAVFPLCIAVQRLGDAEANKMADQAVERIHVALRDATADALARDVEYGPAPSDIRAKAA
jgi:hypothetical protein